MRWKVTTAGFSLWNGLVSRILWDGSVSQCLELLVRHKETCQPVIMSSFFVNRRIYWFKERIRKSSISQVYPVYMFVGFLGPEIRWISLFFGCCSDTKSHIKRLVLMVLVWNSHILGVKNIRSWKLYLKNIWGEKKHSYVDVLTFQKEAYLFWCWKLKSFKYEISASRKLLCSRPRSIPSQLSAIKTAGRRRARRRARRRRRARKVIRLPLLPGVTHTDASQTHTHHRHTHMNST